jgi:hypothetical protein
MCSNVVRPADLARTGLAGTGLAGTGLAGTGSARIGADIATRLAAAIDELAAAASGDQDAAAGELAERLALAWAMIVSADPELAARAAKYSRS